MTIILDLTPDVEARLQAAAERQGESVENLVLQWIEKQVAVQPKTGEAWVKEFLRTSDTFADRCLPVLSDDATSRENLYEDRN